MNSLTTSERHATENQLSYVGKDYNLSLRRLLVCCLIGFSLFSCEEIKNTPPLFQLKSPQETGIDFINRVSDTEEMNIIQYLYYYNGGGVAIGDINNDGLPDIYFSSNLESNKLYLNQDSLRFSDITESAGVAGTGNWSTGVSMVDINADGWLDIYVCQVGAYKSFKGKNQLFINQGNKNGSPQFVEEAAKYGLDHEGFSTQAAWLDYDMDGDLDMYLLCHSVHSTESYRDTSLTRKRDEHAGDKLFRNDFYSSESGHPVFTEVSEEAGILGGIAGYGLGVAVGDVDKNGCPDIYVGNDFHENDFLYLNDCTGKFVESSSTAFTHTSNFSMGNDLADLNNNGLLDLITMDMKPADERIFKSSAGTDPYDIYTFKRSFGYSHQLPRNMLHINEGLAPYSDTRFMENGQAMGLSSSDWSWSGLMADFNNDGIKDIHITNGILRRPNDLDYLKYIANQQIQENASDLELLSHMPDGKIANYLFSYDAENTFVNRATDWGISRPSYSNGAAYADLDQDGDLDLVVNNINDPAFVYENLRNQEAEHHYLKIKLEGPPNNPKGLGAKVSIEQKDRFQYQELYPVRGWQSSVPYELHFGLLSPEIGGEAYIEIIWPDGIKDSKRLSDFNQVFTLKHREAERLSHVDSFKDSASQKPEQTRYRQVKKSIFVHKENRFEDNKRESLIPYLLSTQGPNLAVADVNGDSIPDFFVGGATQQAGALFFMSESGLPSKAKTKPFKQDSLHEDIGVLFFDADQDGDQDLYVGSGGNQFYQQNPALQDRLYINDGKGNFSKSLDALPEFYGQNSCVKAADIDDDGDLDLFVGSRSVPVSYGIFPDSYLLINDGKGHFNIAEPAFIDLSKLGMVTDAAWTDTDDDGDLDLIVVGEWMPIVIFENQHDKFNRTTPSFSNDWGDDIRPFGWWSSIELGDLDQDGDEDWVVGNFGVNSNLQPTEKEPVQLYIKDFDRNLSKDPILTYFKEGKEYPVAGLDELSVQLVMLKKRFRSYNKFANSTLSEIFTPEELQGAIRRKADFFHSVVVYNEDGDFRMEKLPPDAQVAPIHAILIEELNIGQGKEILVAGNLHDIQPSIGRLDGHIGKVFTRDKISVPPSMSPKYTLQDFRKYGLILDGQVRDLKFLQYNKEKLLLVAKNNEALEIYKK